MRKRKIKFEIKSVRDSNTINYKKFVKNIRKVTGISQRELADLIGMSVPTVSAYELGRAIPPLPIFLKILNVARLKIVLVEDIYSEATELTIPLLSSESKS